MICGLGLTQSKILGTPTKWRSLEKLFLKTFFLKNTCGCVLGPCLGLEHSCLWPRECLSSERLSLALASDLYCVLGLGLEPCVLDSTSVFHFILALFFCQSSSQRPVFLLQRMLIFIGLSLHILVQCTE